MGQRGHVLGGARTRRPPRGPVATRHGLPRPRGHPGDHGAGGPRSAFDRHIGHRRHFNRTSLRRTISAAGLDPLRIDAAGFPFFDLYKVATIVRGRKLIEDARRPDAIGEGAGGAALTVFERLFRANLVNSPFGWQLLAVARVPGAGGSRR